VRFALDHVVATVESLGSATAAFRDAGFTVLAGGRHEGLPTENALVVFADGTYLELLATREPRARAELRELRGTPGWSRHLHEASAIGRRFLPVLAEPDGTADFALRVTGLDRVAAESRRRGYAMTGPVALGRTRPDGRELAMRLLFPGERWLPFLIEDRTPLALRVPDDPAARRHANGARGLGLVTVRAPEVVAAAMGYVDFFDATLTPREDGAADATLGDVRVRIVGGEPPGACEAAIAGPASLPPALEALGLRAAG